MYRLASLFSLGFLLISLSTACAEKPEATGAGEAPAPAEPSSFLEGSLQEAEAFWHRSVDSAERWWNHSQQRAETLWQSPPREADPGRRFARLWDDVLPTLEETLALQERQESLPESRWFGEDRQSNREAIDTLLDQTVAILSTSEVQHYRDDIARLQQQIAQARRDIAEYRRQRVSAPRDSLVQRTVADYQADIRAREQDIAHHEEQLAGVKRQFATELRAMGLELSDEQVELLLSTVVGDNLIDLGILFDNVKSITAQLEKLVEESGEDLQSARRYYGIYVVLLKSLHQMHRQVEDAIAGQYVPRIDAIAERALTLSDQTRALQRQAPEKRQLLAANLEAQRLTIEAARVYRQYLHEQGRQVTAARLALELDIAAAWNTYETVRVSGELVGLVKASRQLLDGLFNRQVPALRPFRNLEMQREFEKLTAQLRTRE